MRMHTKPFLQQGTFCSDCLLFTLVKSMSVGYIDTSGLQGEEPMNWVTWLHTRLETDAEKKKKQSFTPPSCLCIAAFLLNRP